MKALEFLRKYQDELQSLVSNEIDLDELIEELVELNNISFNGCKYEAKKDCKGNFITVCKRFPRLTDRYEKKDSK